MPVYHVVLPPAAAPEVQMSTVHEISSISPSTILITLENHTSPSTCHHLNCMVSGSVAATRLILFASGVSVCATDKTGAKHWRNNLSMWCFKSNNLLCDMQPVWLTVSHQPQLQTAHGADLWWSLCGLKLFPPLTKLSEDCPCRGNIWDNVTNGKIVGLFKAEVLNISVFLGLVGAKMFPWKLFRCGVWLLGPICSTRPHDETSEIPTLKLVCSHGVGTHS